MDKTFTPSQVRDRAAKVLITMDQLFVKAQMSPATFWRWERGKPVRPLSLEKLRQALEAIEGEKAALSRDGAAPLAYGGDND